MNTDRMRRVLVPSIALLVLVVGLMIAGSAVTSVAKAAPQDGGARVAATVQTRDAIIEFGDPVRIAENERVQTVVSFGGDVTVAGTVTETVVAFGGDVRILPTARVGGAQSPSDPAIVAMGGTITVADGAHVTGELQRIDGGNWSELVNVPVPHVDAGTWSGFSFIGWLVQTAVFLVLGLVAAALMPRQMLAVGRALSEHPGSSFGWGALVFFVIVPAAALVLLISIIGILLLIPAVVAVPLFYFFVTASVAAFIAQKLISGKGRAPNLMLATTLGIIGTTIVSRVPVAGVLALLVMTLFGTGAAILALVEWRRVRKASAAVSPGVPAVGSASYAAAPYAAATAPSWEAPPPVEEPEVLEAPAGPADAVTTATVGEAPTVARESVSETPVASRRRFRRRVPEDPNRAAAEDGQTPSTGEL
ncbi:MAG TPA: hypothetical protein VFH61_12035 [Thermoleophilia bacterium]|nr:hypothetical protein [Thermoleophilia bacterium]